MPISIGSSGDTRLGRGKDRDFIKSCTSLREDPDQGKVKKNRIYIIMSYVSLILMDFIMYL